MDRLEFSSSNGTENENARIVKKKRRSILKVTSNANNEREALKTIDSDSNAQESGIPVLPVLENVSSKTSTATSNDEGGERKMISKKDKRKSLSRRVSFSATTRVKEFHEGQHEYTQWNSTYEDERSLAMTSSSSSSVGQSSISVLGTSNQTSTVTKDPPKTVALRNYVPEVTIINNHDPMEETDCINSIINLKQISKPYAPSENDSIKKVCVNNSSNMDISGQINLSEANGENESLALDHGNRTKVSCTDLLQIQTAEDIEAQDFMYSPNTYHRSKVQKIENTLEEDMEITENLDISKYVKTKACQITALESKDVIDINAIPSHSTSVSEAEAHQSNIMTMTCATPLQMTATESKDVIDINASLSHSTSVCDADAHQSNIMSMTCATPLQMTALETKDVIDVKAFPSHSTSVGEADAHQNNIMTMTCTTPLQMTALKSKDVIDINASSHSTSVCEAEAYQSNIMSMTCAMPLQMTALESKDVIDIKAFPIHLASVSEAHQSNIMTMTCTTPLQMTTLDNKDVIENNDFPSDSTSVIEADAHHSNIMDMTRATLLCQTTLETQGDVNSTDCGNQSTAELDDYQKNEVMNMTCAALLRRTIIENKDDSNSQDCPTQFATEIVTHQKDAAKNFEIEFTENIVSSTNIKSNECQMQNTTEIEAYNINEMMNLTCNAPLPKQFATDNINDARLNHDKVSLSLQSEFEVTLPIKSPQKENKELIDGTDSIRDKSRDINLNNQEVEDLCANTQMNIIHCNTSLQDEASAQKILDLTSKQQIKSSKAYNSPTLDKLESFVIPSKAQIIDLSQLDSGVTNETILTEDMIIEKANFYHEECEAQHVEQNMNVACIDASANNSTSPDNEATVQSTDEKTMSNEVPLLNEVKTLQNDMEEAGIAISQQICSPLSSKEKSNKVCNKSNLSMQEISARPLNEYKPTIFIEDTKLGHRINVDTIVERKIHSKSSCHNENTNYCPTQQENLSIFEYLYKIQKIKSADYNRFIKENWDIRHGKWNIQKHKLNEATLTKPLVKNNGGAYNVIISFMNDTLELNLTLGHPITPDVLPNIESEETLPATEETARVINRTKITRKVLHWTLLKIEFTNPSKPMMMQLQDDEGEDMKLAHYLLLRSLTPSCLAERCPNTKHLEETLRLISKVVTDATRFTLDLHEIAGSHSFFKIISNKMEHKVKVEFFSIKQRLSFVLSIDYHHGVQNSRKSSSIQFIKGPTSNDLLLENIEKNVFELIPSTNFISNNWDFIGKFVSEIDTILTEIDKSSL